MKILFIGTDVKIFEPGSSVHERFVGFSSLGEEVHIVIARPSLQRSVYRVAENVHAYPTTQTGRFFALIKSFFVGYGIINKDKKSDWVISVQDPFEQGWVGYVLSKIFRKPLHVQVHTDMLSPFFLRNSFFNRPRVLFLKPVLRSAKRIRVDALRMKDSLVNQFKIDADKIDVLQIYIDVPAMLSGSSERLVDGDYILYVGRFEPEKNVESIIRGFAKAAPLIPSLKLVLLGGGALVGEYKDIAYKLGISDRIIIVPWSNNVGAYMRHAKALVLASWFEGFALVLVEALLNDCPIITTDVGAVGGIIPKEYANIFSQDDAESLVLQIQRVIENYQGEKDKVKEIKGIILEAIPKDLAEYTRIFRESLEKSL